MSYLEVEDSSDASYRIYDYDRDNKKNERDLSIDTALDLITYDTEKTSSPLYFDKSDNAIELWRSLYFDVVLLNIKNSYSFTNPDDYLLCTVVSGSLNVLGVEVSIGKSFIITKELDSLEVSGNAKLVLVYPRDV